MKSLTRGREGKTAQRGEQVVGAHQMGAVRVAQACPSAWKPLWAPLAFMLSLPSYHIQVHVFRQIEDIFTLFSECKIRDFK